MTESVRVEIDLAALRHNFQRVKHYAPDSRVISMLKANAYGHGLIPCAKALDQSDAFGVARFSSAIALREAGIKQRIFLMQGVFDAEHLLYLSELNCDLVVHCQEQIELLKKVKLIKPLQVWLKVNTGLNRLGFSTEHVSKAYEALASINYIKSPINLMTHFAWSDQEKYPEFKKQYERFKQVANQYCCETSVNKSAAIINFPDFHSDWVRPGTMLYGVSPFSNKDADDLQPVMSVHAKLISVRQQRRDDLIGYEARFQCPENMLMGVVSVGYGDGYPLLAKEGTPMMIRGKRCSLVGRVNMDMLHVDLRNCPEARVGDDVVLWGEGLPVEEVAKCSGFSTYSLLTGFGRREGKTLFNELAPVQHKKELQRNDKLCQPPQIHAK